MTQDDEDKAFRKFLTAMCGLIFAAFVLGVTLLSSIPS